MIHVFRTSVDTEEQVNIVSSDLRCRLAECAEWNFDLDDHDRILRVVNGGEFTAQHCVEILERNGFSCEELPD